MYDSELSFAGWVRRFAGEGEGGGGARLSW